MHEDLYQLLDLEWSMVGLVDAFKSILLGGVKIEIEVV